MLVFDFLCIMIGIIGLTIGGKYLVDGAVALSLHYGIPPMIVGLTVISFGTSAPELFVSLGSVFKGHADIAYGNAVGSNIANVLVILGVPAIVSTLRTDLLNMRVPWMETMFASLLFWLLVQFEPFTHWQGGILLLAFAVILGAQIRRALKGAEENLNQVDEAKGGTPMHLIFLWIAIGLVALPIAANILVNGAVNIARVLGFSETLIGLTIVAIGTSLPELAASITSVRRGETGVAMGSVFGSCTFNLLLILGSTALLSRTEVDRGLIVFDIPFMVAITAGLAIFVFWKRPISRISGLIMVALYVLYVVILMGR